MQKKQIIQFCNILGLTGVDAHTRSGWVVAKCPFGPYRHKGATDKTPSFGIKIGNNTFGTCFSCDTHGDLEDLLYRLAVYSSGIEDMALKIKNAREFLESNNQTVLSIGSEEEEDPNLIIPFPEEYIHGFPTCYDHSYFETRDGGPIPFRIAKGMGFRLDWKRSRIGVPIRDFSGTLMGFHARTLIGAKPSYLAYTHDNHWNRLIWSGEHRIDLSKPLVMVESIFDEARVAQVYRNVCSPLSASLNQHKIQRMSEALDIVEMFDNDPAGQKAGAKLRRYLPDSVIRKPNLPEGFGDPGETHHMVLADILKNYLELDEIIS